MVLLASWIFGPTRSPWLVLDNWFFLAANSSLSATRRLPVFRAAAKNRAVVIVPAVTFVGLCACWFVCPRKRERLQLLTARGLLLTLMGATDRLER